MDKIRLDMKDRRILEELDRNPNITLSSLAKNVGVSRQVAEYRMTKLVSQKTVYAFYTLIDVGRLGYSSFRVHLRLKNVSEETYSKFAKQLFTDYPTFWVAFISGSFDLIIDIFARNSNKFEEIFSDILKKNKEIIQNYETSVILGMNLYTYGYFIETNKSRDKLILHKNIDCKKIDKTDEKILQKIKLDSRIPYDVVAKEIGISRNSVKNRILKLEENRVIAGYKPLINFNHFDKQSYKIFIKYNNTRIDQEKHLLEYLKHKIGVLTTLKLLGKWNLDIEIHTKDIRELQRFIIELRNKYEIIEDYEIIQIIEDYGIDFYPDKLQKEIEK